MTQRLCLFMCLILLLYLRPSLSVDVPSSFDVENDSGCRIQEQHKSPYVTALLSQPVPSYGCVSREVVPTTQQQVDVLLLNVSSSWTTSSVNRQHMSMAWTTSGHHRQHIYLTLKQSVNYDDSSKSVIYILSSKSPVIWNVRGERFQDLQAEIWVSNHSRVIQERHLRLNVHKVDLPSSLSELVSWTRRRFHALTTLRSIASANSVTLHVGLDNSALETCMNFSVMSNAETVYLRPQNVKGCALSDELATSSKVVHVIELSSAVYGHHSDDMLPNVLVNLSSRSRTSSIRHVVLVLKAQSPVHWHISIQRLHCSLDVITDQPVTSSGFTSEPFRVVAERLTAYSGRSLMHWTSEKYGRPMSYTLAMLANQLEVKVDGKRRRRGGNKGKVNVAEMLRHVISSSLTISCTDSWTKVTIPRSVLESYHLSSDSLSLANASCHATANATHYILSSDSADCESTRVVSSDSVVHQNAILVNYENGKPDENPSSVNHADQLVDEQSLVMINFSCYYPNQLPPMDKSASSQSSDGAQLKLYIDGEEVVEFPVTVNGNELLRVEVGFPADDAVDVMMRRCSANMFDQLAHGTPREQQLILPGCRTADNVTWLGEKTSQFQFRLSHKLTSEAAFVNIFCDVSLCRRDASRLTGGDTVSQCMSRQDFCIMSNIEASSSVMDSKVVSMTTVNVGPLLPLPGNEPAAAAVSLGDSDDEQVASSCSKDAPVVVEGVGFTVVIVIAFAAFVIGVMLMSSLWFIYVKTSPRRKSGVIRSTDTSGDVTPSSTLGALTARHVCVR